MRIALILALLGLALSAALRPGPALACSGPPFSFEYLADLVRNSDVVALGTLRGIDGATIGLDVDVYYKPPEGSPPHLILNNLLQDGWPDCSSRPLRMRAFAEGTPVLVFLKRDEQGIGALWRGSLIQGRGVMPLRDGRAVHFEWNADRSHFELAVASRAELESELVKNGIVPSPPNPATPPERPVPPTSPYTCIHDPYTVASLTGLATIAGVGVIIERTPDVLTVRIDEPLKGGTGPLIVTVNNHWFTGGLSRCEERIGSENRVLSDRDPVLLFLEPDSSGIGAAWRPAGVDVAGLFLPGDIPWRNLGDTAPLTFADLRDEILRAADAPAAEAHTPAIESPGGATAPGGDGGSTSSWLLAAVAGGLVAAAALVFLALRRR